MPPTVKTENKYGLDWVLLNNRWYCVQNYSPTHLADGTPIPIVTGNATWAGLTTPARCVYNNSDDAEFIAKYGYLYNWHGVEEGLEMPFAGCVVPSAQEWADLENWMIANGFNWDGTTEGNKIGKALASDGGEWASSQTAGHIGNDQPSNNSSGFTALPGGFRSDANGTFNNLTIVGYLWLSSGTAADGYRVLISRNAEGISADLRAKGLGLSIRISATAPIVTYNSTGGSAVADEVTFIGELATEPTTPTRAGFNFNGWFADAELTTPWDFATDTVDADTTLYAGWVERKKSAGSRIGTGIGIGIGI